MRLTPTKTKMRSLEVTRPALKSALTKVCQISTICTDQVAFSLFDQQKKNKDNILNPDVDEGYIDCLTCIKPEPSQPKFEKIFNIERRVTKRAKNGDDQKDWGRVPELGSPTNSGGDSIDPESLKDSKSFKKSLFNEAQPLKKRDIKQATKVKAAHEESTQEKAIDDVSESQDRKRKKHKTTEYYYLLERKAIRMMRRYYKEAFESYASKYKYKQNLKRLEKHLADKYFYEYVEVEFQRNQDTLNHIGRDEMVLALETIILCDRYNKNEKVTEGLDFVQIRNLLNKYNAKNLKEFFKNICHAFLFSHYYRLSSQDDVKTQGHVDQEKLAKQMESLFMKSQMALPEAIQATVARKNY